MRDNAVEDKTLIKGPRFLWLLVISYVMIYVLANWFDSRLIQLY